MTLAANIWSVLPLPAFIVAPDNLIRDANTAAETFLSTSALHLRGRPVSDLFGEDSRALDLLARSRSRGIDAADHNVEFLWPKRPVVMIDLLTAMDEGGEDVLLIVHPRSIAEQIDRSLTHRHAARSMIGMAAMLAHEIKNPLAGISGAAQLLEMNASEDDRQLTALIQEESDRIEKLVSRVESFGDNGPPKREPVNIHDILDRAKRTAEVGFAKHVRFHEEYDPSLPPIPGDSDQLMQIFQNLLKNAAEATPEVGGLISLKTSFQQGVAMMGPNGTRVSLPLLVQISDNGRGVPDDLQRDIFEPFVTSKASGSGLGLSLVSKIVADHGGVIECVSRPGWTMFRLRLPIWREPAKAKAAKQTPEERAS